MQKLNISIYTYAKLNTIICMTMQLLIRRDKGPLAAFVKLKLKGLWYQFSKYIRKQELNATKMHYILQT